MRTRDKSTFQQSSKSPYYQIDHIGIAVRDLQQASEHYAKLLGSLPSTFEKVDTENVITTFFQVGASKIELLEATDENCPIAKFVAKRGEGLHHVAFIVDDIHAEIKRLQQQDFVVLNALPKKGAHNKLVCFLHPKSTHGLLIELCQLVSI